MFTYTYLYRRNKFSTVVLTAGCRLMLSCALGSHPQTEPPPHSQYHCLPRGDSVPEGSLHSLDAAGSYSNILHCSCNRNWVSTYCVHRMSLCQSALVGSRWTNGDWPALPFPSLGLRWACFLGVKEGKEERAVGRSSCVPAVNICVCEGLSGRSTRPPCSSWSCHGTGNHPQDAHCYML